MSSLPTMMQRKKGTGNISVEFFKKITGDADLAYLRGLQDAKLVLRSALNNTKARDSADRLIHSEPRSNAALAGAYVELMHLMCEMQDFFRTALDRVHTKEDQTILFEDHNVANKFNEAYNANAAACGYTAKGVLTMLDSQLTALVWVPSRGPVLSTAQTRDEIDAVSRAHMALRPFAAPDDTVFAGAGSEPPSKDTTQGSLLSTEETGEEEDEEGEDEEEEGEEVASEGSDVPMARQETTVFDGNVSIADLCPYLTSTDLTQYRTPVSEPYPATQAVPCCTPETDE